MRRIILAFLICVMSSVARAEVLLAVGTTMLFEESNSGRKYEQRQPWLLRGGYRLRNIDALVEYSQFNVASGSGTVGIVRTRQQALVWGRYSLKQFKLAPFAGLGAGLYSEKVETSLAGDSRSDSGQSKAMGAVSFGLVFPSRWIDFSFEGRVETSPAYAPQLVFGAGLVATAKL